MFLSQYFSFPLSVSFHHCSIIISVSTLLLPEEQTGTFQKQCSLPNGAALAEVYFDSVFSAFRRQLDDDNCPCLVYYAASRGYSLPLFATCTFTINVSYGLWTRGGKTRIYFEMYLIYGRLLFNPLNPELNPICYLLELLGAHHFLHVSRIRVKLLTFRRLMSYIYGALILDVSRSHTTTQHSR